MLCGGAVLSACQSDDVAVPEVAVEEGAPVADAGAEDNAVAGRLNAEMRKVLPRKAGRNWVFDGYIDPRTRKVAWSRTWTSKIDFTGVAWDATKNLTMITPQHALMAKHYLRKLGDPVIFHDREGREVVRTIAAWWKIPSSDAAVVILNEPVPKGIKNYKLLEPSETLGKGLAGALVLVTDAERKVHVHEVNRVYSDMLMFRKAGDLPKGFYEPLISGDSGNPSFVLVRGEPVLVEIHHYGGAGAGPFYGSARIQAGIKDAIAKLADKFGGGEYSFKTVKP